MVVNELWVLFAGHKKRKAWNKNREKYIRKKENKIFAETDRGSYWNQEEWLEEFLDDKAAFYNGSDSDVRDNDDENYNENIETAVHRCSSK